VLGAEPQPLTLDNALAIRAWNMLANGMGGIDWQGFDRIARHLCIEDDEWLIESLYAIRTHRPPEGFEDMSNDDKPETL
jgi:hypothetical protein